MTSEPSVEPARTFVVHGLPPKTTAELAALSCGHCRHRLTYHVTDDNGRTGCAICHCFRTLGESILEPHRFSPGSAGS